MAAKKADKSKGKSKKADKATSKKKPSEKKGKSKVRVPAPTAHVQREWARRVEAEYRSAAITQHLGLWLIQIAASPDLVHDSLRIVEDELAHAELSHATFVAAGGEGMAPIQRESLGLRRQGDEPLELSVARTAVEVFCLGETVAVPLFKQLRDPCVAPVARKALDRVLRDEVRHRDFGWGLLTWLLDQPYGSELKMFVENELPTLFARVRRNYAPGQAQDAGGSVSDAEAAWGLMAPSRYREVLERTYDRDYAPRFAKVGIDAAPAWKAARTLVEGGPTASSEPTVPRLG